MIAALHDHNKCRKSKRVGYIIFPGRLELHFFRIFFMRSNFLLYYFFKNFMKEVVVIQRGE